MFGDTKMTFCPQNHYLLLLLYFYYILEYFLVKQHCLHCHIIWQQFKQFYQYHTKDQTLQLFQDFQQPIKQMQGINRLFVFKITSSSHNNLNHLYLHPLTQSIFNKHIRPPSTPSFSQNKPKASSAIPSKKEITDWFLSLSLQDYAMCTKIDSSKFIQLFLKNYGKGQGKLIHLPSSRTVQYKNSSLLCKYWRFFELLLYAPTSQPQIYIDSEDMPPQALLQQLQDISNNQVFELSLRSFNKQNPEQNLLWFNSNTFHSLPEWVASQIQKNVLRRFFGKSTGQNMLKYLRDYPTTSGLQLKSLLGLRLRDIESWNLQNRQLDLNALRRVQESIRNEFEVKLINIDQNGDQKRARRRKRKGKHQSRSGQQGSQIIHTAPSALQQNCPDLEDSTPNHSQILLSNLEHYQISSQRSELFSPSQKSIEKTSCGQFSQQQQIDRNSSTPLQRQAQQHLQDKYELAEPLFNESDLRKRRRKRKNGNKYQDQFRSKVVHSIMNKQLDSFLDSLSNQSNQKIQSKILAFERIRYFIRSIFPFSDSVLFGSNAVGLSLPTSDIDVMLIGLPYSNLSQLCTYLSQIEVCINTMGWITSTTFYPHAKVPILKLEVDTSVSYLALNARQQDACLACPLDLTLPSNGGKVKVDIIISNDVNGVSPTTQLMRSCMMQRPSLQRVLLALKCILASRGFNQSFKGGIGSYCLFIMVAAYFQHFKEKREHSDCQILMDLLKFYGQEFQNQHQYVAFANSGSCFAQEQKVTQILSGNQKVSCRSQLTVLDPISQKVISSNCHQYPFIKLEMTNIWQKMERLNDSISSQLAKSSINSAEMLRLLQNKKSFDKYTSKLQGKIEMTVGGIISGTQ